jgi:hypothetical protein
MAAAKERMPAAGDYFDSEDKARTKPGLKADKLGPEIG